MGLFEDVVVNAKSAANVVGKKAGQLMDISKLRLSAADINREISRRLEALGRTVYDAQKSGYDPSELVAESVSCIDELYEQLDAIFDQLAVNDNGLLDRQTVRRFSNLGNRTERFLGSIQNLREAVAQLREAYQSQLAIQQNDLMKIFTLVTVVFLPLTLLVGWYGMNFVSMPELRWRYGYPAVAIVGLAIAVGLVWFFRRKKWL